MKTATEVLIDIWTLLNVTELTSEITGDIYKVSRPSKSDKIDLVIGLLGVDNEYMQQGTVNVKIHVPNLKVTIDGMEDSTMPDLEKINSLNAIACQLLDTQWRDTFHTEVNETLLRQDPDGNWFSRIVVDYYSLQTNYQNI